MKEKKRRKEYMNMNKKQLSKSFYDSNCKMESKTSVSIP